MMPWKMSKQSSKGGHFPLNHGCLKKEHKNSSNLHSSKMLSWNVHLFIGEFLCSTIFLQTKNLPWVVLWPANLPPPRHNLPPSKIRVWIAGLIKGKPMLNKPCLEPQTTIYKLLFKLDDSKSLYRKWLFHQTSIYKWLFGVPGDHKASYSLVGGRLTTWNPKANHLKLVGYQLDDEPTKPVRLGNAWKSPFGCFQKIVVPQNVWFIVENLLKWIIWGYHHLRKYPFPFKKWLLSSVAITSRGQPSTPTGGDAEKRLLRHGRPQHLGKGRRGAVFGRWCSTWFQHSSPGTLNNLVLWQVYSFLGMFQGSIGIFFVFLPRWSTGYATWKSRWKLGSKVSKWIRTLIHIPFISRLVSYITHWNLPLIPNKPVPGHPFVCYMSQNLGWCHLNTTSLKAHLESTLTKQCELFVGRVSYVCLEDHPT